MGTDPKTTEADIDRWLEFRQEWPGVFQRDEEYLRLRRLVPRDGSCTCRAMWRINVAGGLGLAGWHCPEHGTVLPDAHGSPRQNETVEARRVTAEAAEKGARNTARREHAAQRRLIAAQMGLDLDA